MRILGIIPARGGSKGVLNKNIRICAGKPLVAWTIEQTKKSQLLDKFIVSTEDEKIASIAKDYGAEVPFKRPVYLSDDKAKSADVVVQALEWFAEKGDKFDIVVLLQPTSPLRLAGDIDNAIKLLFEKKAKAIVSLCPANHPPDWIGTIGRDGSMKDFIDPQIAKKPRQEIGNFYQVNGAVYVAYSEYLLKERNFYGKDTTAYIMPQERSIDIDSEIDLEFAEHLLKINMQKDKKL